jgi:hypothetical protein
LYQGSTRSDSLDPPQTVFSLVLLDNLTASLHPPRGTARYSSPATVWTNCWRALKRRHSHLYTPLRLVRLAEVSSGQNSVGRELLESSELVRNRIQEDLLCASTRRLSNTTMPYEPSYRLAQEVRHSLYTAREARWRGVANAQVSCNLLAQCNAPNAATSQQTTSDFRLQYELSVTFWRFRPMISGETRPASTTGMPLLFHSQTRSRSVKCQSLDCNRLLRSRSSTIHVDDDAADVCLRMLSHSVPKGRRARRVT